MVHSLLVILLIAEGLFLGVMFDSASLARLPGGWWQNVFEAVPRVMPISAAIAAAGLLVAGPRLRQRVQPASEARPRVWAVLLFVHLGCFAALFVLSVVLFNRSAASYATGRWVVAWLLASGLTLASWLVAYAGPRAVYGLARETLGLLLASAAIGVIAWAAGQYTQGWWAALRTPTLRGAYALLRGVDQTAWVDPGRYLIGAGSFAVEVSTDCSGYEGVGLLWIFLGTFFWFSRTSLRFPHALLMLPVATAAIVVANLSRIAVLVLVGAHVSPAVAAGGFHSYAGIVLFCAVSLAAAAVTQRAPFFAAQAPADAAAAPESRDMPAPAPASPATRLINPAAPFLLPFLATIATALLTAMLFQGACDPFYPVRVLVAAALLWHYRHAYRGVLARRTAQQCVVPALIGIAVFAMWIVLAARIDESGPAPRTATATTSNGRDFLSPGWQVVWSLFRMTGAIVTVPLSEELAFRGYLARRLMDSDFETVRLVDLSGVAIVVSSILFGVLHGTPLAGALAGVAFAWAAKRRGALGDAVIAHATANGLLAAYVLVTRSWWLWG